MQCQRRKQTRLSLAEGGLLVWRRIRRPAYMQVAQIMQRGLVFFTQPASEVWIVQPLIARGLRHVLEDAQPLLDRLPTFRRKLPPRRQYIILNVVALFQRHLPPRLLALALVRFLLRCLAIPLPELFANAVLLFRRQIAKCRAVPHHALAVLRLQIAHRVDPRPRRAHPQLLPGRKPFISLRVIAARNVTVRSYVRILHGRTIRRTILIRGRPVRIPLREVLFPRGRLLFLLLVLGNNTWPLCMARR
jgi:hypothetical protein